MNYTENIQLGKELALVTEHLPKSSFPQKITRLVIWRDEYPDNPREYFSPMWHFVSVSKKFGWSFRENDHDTNADSRTEAIDTICQHFGVAFNWDGDELSHESLLKLIRNAKRKGVILGLDRNYYTNEFSSHNDMLDNVAYAYISWDEIRHEYSGMSDEEALEKALKYLEGELYEYNAWITGDVYGWTAYDENGNEADSCGGYYGEKEIAYIKTLEPVGGATLETIIEIKGN